MQLTWQYAFSSKSCLFIFLMAYKQIVNILLTICLALRLPCNIKHARCSMLDARN